MFSYFGRLLIRSADAWSSVCYSPKLRLKSDFANSVCESLELGPVKFVGASNETGSIGWVKNSLKFFEKF